MKGVRMLSNTGNKDSLIIIDSLQDFYSEIIEYYDELFPFDPASIDFIQSLKKEIEQSTTEIPNLHEKPYCRLLNIGSATGILENKLAQLSFDVTGIDRNQKMIETAKRRLRRGLANARFFELSILEMRHFLTPQSFKIISCLDTTLNYIADDTLIKKFLFDCKTLLAPGGRLVIQIFNFTEKDLTGEKILPERSSIRVKLTRKVKITGDNRRYLHTELELGNGKIIQLANEVSKIYPITKAALEDWAKQAGFESCKVYKDFNKNPWSEESDYSLFVLS